MRTSTNQDLERLGMSHRGDIVGALAKSSSEIAGVNAKTGEKNFQALLKAAGFIEGNDPRKGYEKPW